MSLKGNMQVMRKLATDRGGKCLSGTYINSQSNALSVGV